MNTKKEISLYLEKHPFVLVALIFSCVWVSMGFVNKDKEMESIKYYLTDTASSDYFTTGCEEFLEKAEYASINSEMKNRICDGLASVVDETNGAAIEGMYETDRENYEYYKQSQQ